MLGRRFKNPSATKFKGVSINGVSEFSWNVDSTIDRDGADNDAFQDVIGIQEKTGTASVKFKDIRCMTAGFSVGDNGSLRSTMIAKAGTTTNLTVVIAKAYFKGFGGAVPYGDLSNVTANYEFNPSGLSYTT